MDQSNIFQTLIDFFLTPMKFASLLIDMNFIGQAEPRRPQSFNV